MRFAAIARVRTPHGIYIALFGGAYVLAAGLAQALAFIPNTGVSLWPPSGLFVATLLATRERTWPFWIATALVAELICNALWFHNAVPVAVGIFAGNAVEAVTGALLLRLARGWPFRLARPGDVVVFLLLAVAVAPAVGTIIGASTLAISGLQPFLRGWLLLWVGDATGVLIVAPLVLVLLSWREQRNDFTGSWIEACVLLILLVAGSIASYTGYLPFAYITLPALLWAAVRFEFKGAAISIIVVTILTAGFAAAGVGQFVGDPGTQTLKHVMLQLYLAISALTTLVVAAIARQNREVVEALERSNEELEARVAERTAMLGESEAKFRHMADTSPAMVWQAGPDGLVTFIARSWYELTGQAPLGAAQRGWLDVVHPDDQASVERLADAANSREAPFRAEYRIASRDRGWRWILDIGVPYWSESGVLLGWIGSALDITERKTAEDRLQYQLKLNRNIMDTVPASIFVNDADGNIAFVNPEVERVFGYSSADLMGKSLHEIVHYKHRDGRPFPIEECPMGFVYEHGQGIRKYETVFWHRNGQPVDVVCSSVPMVQDGKTIGDVIAVSDVTEIKRSEQALAIAAERTAIAQDAADAWSYEYRTSDETIQRVGAFREVTGYELEEFASGREWKALIHPEDALIAWQTIAQGILGAGFSLDYRLRHKAGHYIWVHDQARVLRSKNGYPDRVIGMTFDMTEQKRREQQLQLLMHEVNHRTKNVLSLVQAIARQTAATDPQEFLARFTDRVRALAANQDLLVANDWQGVDIEALVRAQLAPFSDLIGERISISGEPVQLSPPAAQSIGLALHELATNAGKYGALAGESGRVTVEWRRHCDEFVLSWTELTDEPICPPTREGFGTTVIARLAKLSLDGEVEIKYAPTGLVWHLRCPAARALDA